MRGRLGSILDGGDASLVIDFSDLEASATAVLSDVEVVDLVGGVVEEAYRKVWSGMERAIGDDAFHAGFDDRVVVSDSRTLRRICD